jgi:uncharacterized repeat protein (TIGR01451 family)
MNSKKKLTVLGLTVFLFLMQNLSFAQPASYDNGNIIVTLPTLRSTQPPPNLQYYTLFIETGDGNYMKSGRIENANSIPPQYIPYPYRINTKYNGVVNIVGHYDTFPPPLRQILINPISNPTTINVTKQIKLLNGSKIGFDYSDTTLVPGDTTTMVVTYKTDPVKSRQGNADDYIIAFFYNYTDQGSAGKIFSEIDNTALKYRFNSSVENVRAIRMSNSETPFADIPDNTIISSAVSSSLTAAKRGYNNGLYFIVPHGASTDEKNIFISLATDKLNENNYYSNSTTFKIVKIKYNKATGTIIGTPEEKPITLPIRFLARDPNGISISPNCLHISPGRKLRNRITFQNDGPGDAVNVKVTMTIPTGMEFPPANFAPVLHTSNQLTFFKPNSNPDKSPDNFYSFDVLHRQINFTMNNIKLKGTRPQPTVSEIKRRGQIIFDLKPMISPLDECVNIDVSIVFINSVDGHLWENKPIKVSESIKKNCKPGVGRCPRLPLIAQ